MTVIAPIWQLAFINGVGSRVGESGFGLITDFAYTRRGHHDQGGLILVLDFHILTGRERAHPHIGDRVFGDTRAVVG